MMLSCSACKVVTMSDMCSVRPAVTAAISAASPVKPPGGPHYLTYYEDALTANGVAWDVYDVDAENRTARGSFSSGAVALS